MAMFIPPSPVKSRLFGFGGFKGLLSGSIPQFGLPSLFKKSVGEVEELPDGSPKLLEVLNHYKKRKATDEGYGSLTGTPSKKAKLNGVHAKVCMNGKKDESSSLEGASSEDEEDEKMKPAVTNGKTNGKSNDKCLISNFINLSSMVYLWL